MEYAEYINETDRALMRLKTGLVLFPSLKNLPESPIRKKEIGVDLVSKGFIRSIKNLSPGESCCRLCKIVIMLSTVIFFLSIMACQENIPLPQHLVGEWKTSEPQYEDRYLKITEGSLIYGIGEGEEVSHTVERITVQQENGETIYTFHYRDAEGEKCDLALIYNPVSETVRLKNRNDTWEKVTLENP
ncbi:MAG: hypothetical protein A2Y81_09695 [Nitrospirae bacterium RBG_13_43_8]|nr:MAG: hypothetical protein A2Y81_09695 [Nitrospirae bacterium RBG_13_43_8]